MTKWSVAVILTSCLGIFSVRASPADAWYAEDFDDMFWFLVIADTHVGQNLWGGTQDTDNLAWVVGEAFQVIQPRFIFVCGDLVDGTHGGLIPKNQSDEEWSQYRSILDAHKMTPAVYVDAPGNHDQYCDKGFKYYRKYSIQGSANDTTQHVVVHNGQRGFYHFLTVATPGNDGACWPADNAGLDAAELDFIRTALASSEGARLRFAFGHHGVRWGESNKVGEGASEFRQLMQKYQVAAYFWGHTHAYLSEFHDGTLFFNVRSLGKNDDRNVALAAVDHDSLAVRVFTARKWPFVLITAPANRALGGGNPYAYKVPRAWATAPVRALAFSLSPPQGVRFRVNDGPWQAMSEVRPGVYQGTMDATTLNEGEHRLRVRADPWNDADHEIRFLVGTTICSNGNDDDQDGLVDFPDDPGCLNLADEDEQDPPPVPEPEPPAEEVGQGTEPTPEEVVSEENVADHEEEVTLPDLSPRDTAPEEHGINLDAADETSPEGFEKDPGAALAEPQTLVVSVGGGCAGSASGGRFAGIGVLFGLLTLACLYRRKVRGGSEA